MTRINARFEQDGEGFSATGGLQLAGYVANGGHKDGYFGYTDLGLLDVNYYQASSEFTGDKTAFLHGSLSYYVKDSGALDVTGEADVKLIARDGTVLVAHVGQAGNDWTHMSVELDSGGRWHIGTLDGALATDQQIGHVLRDVDQLQVRADYSTGLDSGGLDQLRLRTAPQHHSDVGPNAFAADGHGAALAVHAGEPHHLSAEMVHAIA